MGQIITGKSDVLVYQCNMRHEFTKVVDVNALWEDHRRAKCPTCSRQYVGFGTAPLRYILRDVVVTFEED